MSNYTCILYTRKEVVHLYNEYFKSENMDISRYTFTYPDSPQFLKDMYISVVRVVQPLLEKYYGRAINGNIFYIEDRKRNYSYVSYETRNIYYNVCSYSIEFFGTVAERIMNHMNMGNGSIVTNTLIIDNVVHEMVHLIIDTDASKYSTDNGYKEIIENAVKLNTLAFIKRFKSVLEQYFGYIDIDMLTDIRDQYKWNNVRMALGYVLVYPFAQKY